MHLLVGIIAWVIKMAVQYIRYTAKSEQGRFIHGRKLFIDVKSLQVQNGPNLMFGFQNSEAIWAVENYAESNVSCLSLYVHLAGMWRIQRRRHDNDMVQLHLKSICSFSLALDGVH